jgi:hypothetical protein
MFEKRPNETQYFYPDLDAEGDQLQGSNSYAAIFPYGQTSPDTRNGEDVDRPEIPRKNFRVTALSFTARFWLRAAAEGAIVSRALITVPA